MPRFAFKFIAGKYEGGEYLMPAAGEAIIGRAIEVEICLVEDMVSRRHAKIEITNDRLILSDLGSTNGTFVNGERIDTCEIELNDRVLVGTTIMRVVDGAELLDQGPVQHRIATEPSIADAAPQPASAHAPQTGSLAERPLAEVITGLSHSQLSGELRVTCATHTAKLGLSAGALVDAQIDDMPYMVATKALCRVLAWSEGSYVFHEGPAQLGQQRLDGSCAALLAEAAQRNSDAMRLTTTLPIAPHAALELSRPLKIKLSDLDPTSLDTLQLALDHGTVAPTLDHSSAPDAEVLATLSALVERGILRAAS